MNNLSKYIWILGVSKKDLSDSGHSRVVFTRLKSILQHAEMDLEGVTIEQLEDDRCKWRREINTALEDYKSAKEESTRTRVEEDWEEVAKLREKLEKILSEKITSGDLSPECITQSVMFSKFNSRRMWKTS